MRSQRSEIFIDKKMTEIIAMDVRKGIAGRLPAPYAPSEVIENSSKPANVFKDNKTSVLLAHMQSSEKDPLKQSTYEGWGDRGRVETDRDTVVPVQSPKQCGALAKKSQLGALCGSELEFQLIRANVTLILCRSATDYTVRSIPRFADEYERKQIFAELVMPSISPMIHCKSIRYANEIFGEVRNTEQIQIATNREQIVCK